MIEEDEVAKLQNTLNQATIDLNKYRLKWKVLKTLFVICIMFVFLVSLALVGALNQGRENIFAFYYAKDIRQRFGVDDLESYLGRWQWIEGAYVTDKFDCSEMSACIERRLENEGYHTIIATGKCPWNSSQRHAWLLVETSENRYMPVEATQYKLVKWDDPNFDSYFANDYSFETIQDALRYSYNDFNWWES